MLNLIQLPRSTGDALKQFSFAESKARRLQVILQKQTVCTVDVASGNIQVGFGRACFSGF